MKQRGAETEEYLSPLDVDPVLSVGVEGRLLEAPWKKSYILTSLHLCFHVTSGRRAALVPATENEGEMKLRNLCREDRVVERGASAVALLARGLGAPGQHLREEGQPKQDRGCEPPEARVEEVRPDVAVEDPPDAQDPVRMP